MATTPKVLGQIYPSNNNLTTLYTVPGATRTTVSSIVITNMTASAATFRISIAVAGLADTNKQYLYMDLPIAGNDTFIATIGATLGPADVIRVRSSSGNTLTFQAFGIEVA